MHNTDQYDRYINALKQLPIEKRFDFALAEQHKIQGGLQLSEVLKLLPEEEQLQFVKTHLQKTYYAGHLAEVLDVFPKEKRLELAKTYQNYILESDDLAKILELFPDEERLDFVKIHQDCIGGYGVARILNKLPKGARVDFAKTCQKYIYYSYQLAEVLGQLPNENRFDFARDHLKEFPNMDRGGYKEPKIHTCDDLIEILRQLPLSDRLEFAKIFRTVIKHGYYIFRSCQHCEKMEYHDLVQVLKYLPKEKRLEFTIPHEKKINSVNELINILEILRPIDRLPLALKCLEKLKHAERWKDKDEQVTSTEFYKINNIFSKQFRSFSPMKPAGFDDVIKWINQVSNSYLEIKKATRILVLSYKDKNNIFSKLPVEITKHICNYTRDAEIHTEHESLDIMNRHFNGLSVS